MEYTKLLFEFYNEKGILMLLYAIGWILIVLLEKDRNHKTVMAFSAWYLPLVILNPLVGSVFAYFDIMPNRMVRIYWLLPVVWVIAYGLTKLVTKVSDTGKWLGTATFLALVVGLIVVGKPLVTEENFVRTQNKFKLPNEVIEVVDKINADYDAGLSDSRKVVLPEELAAYARVYDGTLPLLYGRLPDTDEAGRVFIYMSYDTLNMEEIADGARNLGCGYLVLDSEKPCENAPKEAVVTKFAEVGKYCLYRLD